MVKRCNCSFFLIVLLISLLPVAAFAARWTLIKKDQDTDYYIDARSIRYSQNVFFFKALLKNRYPLYGPTTIFMRKKINCTKNNVKLLDYSVFRRVNRYQKQFSVGKKTPNFPNYIFSTQTVSEVCNYLRYQKRETK